MFQELSLCANLTVAENMTIVHPQLRGAGWRRKATALMREKLEEIFPGNGLKGNELVSDLTLTQQQMVEIARGFTVTDAPVRLVILDEPTSSLDAHTADQLLAFVRRAAQSGITCVLITHRMALVRMCDRIYVFDGGRIIAQGTHDELMALGPGSRYHDLYQTQASGYQDAVSGDGRPLSA